MKQLLKQIKEEIAVLKPSEPKTSGPKSVISGVTGAGSKSMISGITNASKVSNAGKAIVGVTDPIAESRLEELQRK